jgi:methionyl-tRNA formyltransferase
MRVVFFGSPEAALPSLEALLEAGHKISLVVTQPDRPSGRGKRLSQNPVKQYALVLGLPVLQPERIRKDPEALAAIRAAEADIHVVVAYGQIIPASIFNLPAFGSVNVHFSLLPKYRGASPVQWALFNGETKTGVTIFKLNENMDEGDILTSVETDILPEENAGMLEARLARIGAELLVQTLAEIDRIVPAPQDHAAATHAPKLQKDAGKIDWDSAAALIGRQVRAFTPWPSAFTFLHGRRLIILGGRAMEAKTGRGRPGSVAAIVKSGIEVCCKDGSLFRIERLRPENRTAMDAYAFSLGGRIKPGDVLG